MTQVSPEYRDPLDMEIWYKNIGDNYALYLMERVKFLEAENDVLEEGQNDEITDLECKIDSAEKVLEALELYVEESDTLHLHNKDLITISSLLDKIRTHVTR